MGVRNGDESCEEELGRFTVEDNSESFDIFMTAVICQGETYRIGNVQYGSNGTFKWTLISSGGCDSTITVDLNITSDLSLRAIESTPEVNDGIDGAVSVKIEGGLPPYFITWEGHKQEGGPVDNSIRRSFGGLASGTYAATVIDDNGCSIIGNFTINSKIILCDEVMPIGENLPDGADICYFWMPSEELSNPTDKVQTPAPTETTTYTVTVTNEQGNIIEIQSFTVEHIDLSVQIEAPQTVCQGNEFTLTADHEPMDKMVSFAWEHQESGTTYTDPSITLTEGGTYSVTVTDENGCTAMANTTINTSSIILTTSREELCKKVLIPSFPGTPTVPTDPSCENLAVLSAAPGYNNYQWSAGVQDGTSKFNKMVRKAGTYSVTATDANGCTSTASVTITEEPYCLTPEFDSPPDVLCGGTETNLKLTKTYGRYINGLMEQQVQN